MTHSILCRRDRCCATLRLIQRDGQRLLELCLNGKTAFGCGNGQRIRLGLFFSQRYIGTRDFPARECAGLCRLKLQFRAGHGLDHIATGIFAAVDRYLAGAFNADSALAGVIQHDLRLLYIAVDIRDGERNLLPRTGAIRFKCDQLIIAAGTGIRQHYIIRKIQFRSFGIAADIKSPYSHIQVRICSRPRILCRNDRHDQLFVFVIVPTRKVRRSVLDSG